MLGLPGFRLFRWPPKVDTFHWFDPALTSTFKAGIRVALFDASRPRRWVEVDAVWCRPTAWPKPVIERAWVTGVRVSPYGFRRTALQFDSPDNRYAGIILYPRDPKATLALFAHHHWPVG